MASKSVVKFALFEACNSPSFVFVEAWASLRLWTCFVTLAICFSKASTRDMVADDVVDDALDEMDCFHGSLSIHGSSGVDDITCLPKGAGSSETTLTGAREGALPLGNPEERESASSIKITPWWPFVRANNDRG